MQALKTEPTPAQSTGAKRGSFGLIAAGLAVLHLVCGLLLFEPTLFPGGDNAGYLILGDALRSGEGYRDLHLPGAPLHARYPPLLPVLLAGLGAVGGVGVAKLAMLALTTTAVWVTAFFGRRWVGRGTALGAAALLAVNPTLLEYGHYILSEAPFTLLILLALWFAQREDLKGAAIAMAAAVGAFATRSAGMTVLVALPLAWLVAGRHRRAAWSGGVAIAALGAWAMYQRWAAAEQPGYVAELLLVDPYTPSAGSVGFAGLFVRAAENCWAYVSRVVPETLIGPGAGAGGPAVALGLAVTGAALAGWTIRARSRPRAPEVFAVLYGGLIAVWPSVWTDRRFLLPLVPVLLLLALAFVAQLAEPHRRWARLSVLGVVGAVGLGWVARTVPDRMACVAAYHAGHPCDPAANASLYAAARWARTNTPEDAVIANRKPRLFYWYARRRGDLYPFSADPPTVMKGLDDMGADYVVVDQISATTGRYLIPTIRAYEARFEPVYQGGNPPTLIFRIVSAPANAD